MKVGSSDYNHHGGSIQLSAGKTKGNARGGSVDIAAGDGTAKKGGRGGSLTLTAGDAFGDDPSDNGGDLTMIGGSANGGVGGSMKFQTGSSNEKDSGAIGKLLKCLSGVMELFLLFSLRHSLTMLPFLHLNQSLPHPILVMEESADLFQ